MILDLLKGIERIPFDYHDRIPQRCWRELTRLPAEFAKLDHTFHFLGISRSSGRSGPRVQALSAKPVDLYNSLAFCDSPFEDANTQHPTPLTLSYFTTPRSELSMNWTSSSTSGEL